MNRRVYGGLNAEFWNQRPLVGMVHLRALPGCPYETGESLQSIIEHAIIDAQTLEAAGASAVIVENFDKSHGCSGFRVV